MIILVTGGARSGKSLFAERYGAYLAKNGGNGESGVPGGNHAFYIATSQALDDEMRRRVELHRQRRAKMDIAWETVEEPYELGSRLLRLAENAEPVILVDCLTLWLSNWLLRCERDSDPFASVMARVEELATRVLPALRGHIILVTNEVGDGVVPEYPLGRLFRDLTGVMNQRIAAVSDQVFLVTAGIPVELKRIAFRIPDGKERPT